MLLYDSQCFPFACPQVAVSGAWLQFALISSGLLSQSQQEVRPWLSQLKMGWRWRPRFLCECERTDKANTVWTALKYLHWWLMLCLCTCSDTCWKMETLATKTDVPGNFPVSTPTKTGNSLATAVNPPSSSSSIFHIFSSAVSLVVSHGVCDWNACGRREAWRVRPESFHQHRTEWNLCWKQIIW